MNPYPQFNSDLTATYYPGGNPVKKIRNTNCSLIDS